MRGAGGRRPPKEKEKKKKKKEKKEKREKKKKERKKEGNYELRQITTYKVLFFFQFFNSPVALKNKKKFWLPQENIEMTLLISSKRYL